MNRSARIGCIRNFIPVITLNSASGIVAMAWRGKRSEPHDLIACSSSAHALGQAMHAIRAGNTTP